MSGIGSSQPSSLVLGWQVTATGEPQYWRDSGAKAGASEQEPYLVRVPAGAMGTHTAIIAQSGSGKSFFLGRLIEELMVRTHCNCIILDPNADFRRVNSIEGENLWRDARYDPARRRGKLPHESSRKEFEELWRNVSIEITGGGLSRPRENYEQLKLWWPRLSVEFLGEDLEPRLRSDLYHCHAIVQAFETLWKYTRRKPTKPIDLLSEAQNALDEKSLSKEKQRARLQERFLVGKEADESNEYHLDFFQKLAQAQVEDAIERVLAATAYSSDEVERFYFGKAREYVASGILTATIEPGLPRDAEKKRLRVVDLPSLQHTSTRLLAINALLTTLWEDARAEWNSALAGPEEQDTRVPTFVIVDEAHNLISANPRNRAETALTDQFRTIIAEGRKYGLFLILVSQRPDKLDAQVVSECENKAIMKLGSETVVDLTEKMLGLESVPKNVLLKSLEYEVGSVLLLGRWAADGPQRIYCAARRTTEGGRNLRESHWATSPFQQRPVVANSKRQRGARRPAR